MRNYKKAFKHRIIGCLAFLILGLAALLLGHAFHIQSHAMDGIAFGFIPVGLGGLIIYHKLGNSPQMQRSIESEEDERSRFIRNQAGHTAFWISYGYVFLMTMFGEALPLSEIALWLTALIFMPVVYFTCYFIGQYKY